MSNDKIIYTDICEEIKDTVSLQEEMEKHGLTLLRSGRKLKCACPFHNEKDPSLYINIEDEVEWFYCFGCDKNGTVIDFIQYFLGLNLTETIRYFCDNYTFRSSFKVVSIEDLLTKKFKEKKDRHFILPLATRSSLMVREFLQGSKNKMADLFSISHLLQEIDESVEMEDREYLKAATRVLEDVISIKKKKRESNGQQ
jgi:DNA primase